MWSVTSANLSIFFVSWSPLKPFCITYFNDKAKGEKSTFVEDMDQLEFHVSPLDVIFLHHLQRPHVCEKGGGG